MGQQMAYRMHVASFEVIGRIVAEGLGIAITPRDAVKALDERLVLVLVPLDEPWAERHIVMCMRDYGSLPRPARWLVDHLRLRGQTRAAS